MRELDSILSTWSSCEAHDGQGVLATVVDVKGSAYRHPGTRMLLTSDGDRVGTISGGCLEGDIIRKAWWWTESGKPVIRTYDSTSDEAVWEFGLGCNGVVRILIERLGTVQSMAAIDFLNRCRLERKPAVMATVVSSPSTDVARVGDRWFLEPNGSTSGTIDDMMVRDWTEAEADAALFAMRSRLLVVPHALGAVEVFVEVIAPPVPLLLFGGGPDALPVVRLAKELGWHVTVADSRPSYGQAHRFPQADRVILTQPDNPLEGIRIEPNSIAVVMNLNYPADRKVLERLASHSLAFIGMLGPRARTERILNDLNLRVPGELHAPVGLDIGAETPEAIALSIIAEIQTVLSGRSARMLRDVVPGAPIHTEGQHEIALCA
jgi:xanthine/CO dehydrogenase XdhC/CoxF family maturation factor